MTNSKTTKMLLSLVLTLSLIGCAFGGGDDDQLRQENEDRMELLSLFTPLYGMYSGEIQTPERMVPVEIAIYSEDDIIGKTDSGQPRTLPVLKVRYREKDTVRPYLRLNARYDKVLGEIVAATGQAAAQPLSLRLSVKDGTLSGEVIKSLGRFGFVRLTRKSTSTVGPGFDEERQLQEDLRSLYASVIGLYEGRITPPEDMAAPYPVAIKLTTVEVLVNGKIQVRLKANYQRKDFSDPSVSERFMDVDYQAEYTPARIAMSSEGTPAGGVPNSLFFSLVGEMVNGKILGKVYDRRGFMGDLELTKK